MLMKVDKTLVAERIVNFTHDSYVYTYGLIQSVALGAAAFWPRLSFWCASMFALLVTSSTTARGVIITGDQYNLFDTILPIALGLSEFLLFTVLQPHIPGLWLCWYLAFGLFALCAAAITLNRLSMARKEEFDPSLEKLPEMYMSWLKKDWEEAARVGVIFVVSGVIAIWILPRYNWMVPWHTIVGFMTTLFMFRVIQQTEKQRSDVAKYIRNQK